MEGGRFVLTEQLVNQPNTNDNYVGLLTDVNPGY